MTHVARPRIIAKIKASADLGISMIVAPAGYGKSEAIRSAFDPSTPTISIPEKPNVESIATALGMALFPDRVSSLDDAFRIAAATDRREAIGDWLVSNTASTKPEIVIVEDVERLNGDPDARTLLERLIEKTINSTRWVIASREYPQFASTTIWLTRGLMQIPVSASDLTFTHDEATELARSVGLSPSKADIQSILARTEGWPIVLHLFFVAMAQGGDLTGIDFAFDYIANHVWERTNGAMRDTLVAAAFVPNITSEHIIAADLKLPSNSLDMLSRTLPLLQRSHAGGFRLHDLLRQFIIERHRDDQDVSRIAEALAQAFLQHQEPLIALEIFQATKNWVAIERILIEQGPSLIESGRRDTVAQIINRLPTLVLQSPNMQALLGLIAVNDGKDELGTEIIERAIALGITSSIEIACRFRMFRMQTIQVDHVRQIEIIGPLTTNSDSHVRAKAMARLSYAYAISSENAMSEMHASQAIALMSDLDIETRADVLVQIARSTYVRGEMDEALSLASDARRMAVDIDQKPLMSVALGVMLSILSSRQETTRDTAIELLGEWERAVAPLHDVASTVFTWTLRIFVLLRFGPTNELLRVIGSVAPAFRAHPAIMMGTAEALIQNGRFEEALAYIRSCESAPVSAWPYDYQYYLEILSAVASALSGDEQRAATIINKSEQSNFTTDRDHLKTRELECSRRTFLFIAALAIKKYHVAKRIITSDMQMTGRYQPIQRIGLNLVHLCSTSLTASNLESTLDELTESEPWIVNILRHALRPIDVQKPTPREVDVLQELANDLTSGEIASRIGISAKSVDKIIGRLMSRLGCSKRSQLLKIAIDEGWLRELEPIRLAR